MSVESNRKASPKIRSVSFLVLLSLMTIINYGRSRVTAEDVIDSGQYQQAVADRIRKVTKAVLPSIVSIEVIGVLQSDGEVRQDAPTTGVFVDSEGYVLASSWVSQTDSASIIVSTASGKRFPATIIGRDEHRELTLLKIDPKDTPVQALVFDPNAKAPPIGSTMIAVARYGQSGVPMISSGVLSAVDRLDGTAIQTDARISPVFYGGPLLDIEGNVAGILIPAVGENGAEESTAWYDSGIAFAIPSDVIASKMERLRRGETIQPGLLGFVVGGADPYAPGTAIAAVRKRSPAERAGLKVGDELIEVGGRKVRRRQEIKLALGRFDAGEEVTIRYRRDGNVANMDVTLVETIEPLRPQSLGVTLDELKVTSVLPNSPADGVLLVGDQLQSLDEAEIKDVASLRQRLWAADADTSIKLKVLRASKDNADSTEPSEVTLTPDSWAGPLDRWGFDSLPVESDAGSWKQTEIRLPDVTNKALLWHPDASAEAEASGEDNESSVQSRIPLMVVLLPPSQRKTKVAMGNWSLVAEKLGVAICLIASEDTQRWQLSEIDAVTKVTAAAMKQCDVNPDAVAIVSPGILAGGNSSDAKSAAPADSMALAVSLSTENLFHGVAIPVSTRPPAIRLRRDAPMRLLRVLMDAETEDDLPPWSENLKRIGCPLQTTDRVDQEMLLDWCRSLLLL